VIVYNHSAHPIVITTHWHPDPKGGPSAHRIEIMIAHGEAVDLEVIGLLEKPVKKRKPPKSIRTRGL
jgi:hypothetical protein